MKGFVYAIECAGRVKIGYSEDPRLRFVKIRADAPFPCAMLGYWSGGRIDESAIHQRFSDIRVHGEWFAKTAALTAFIEAERTDLPDVAHQPSEPSPEASDIPAFAAHMKSTGVTDAELAAKVGCGRSMITKVRAGAATPSLRLAVAISTATGVPVESLVPPHERKAAS